MKISCPKCGFIFPIAPHGYNHECENQMKSRIFPNGIVERSVVFANTGIAKAEKMYNATFVGDFPLPLKNGGWSDLPAAVFWQEKIPDQYKDVPGASNYLALYARPDKSIWVTSGSYLVDRKIDALKTRKGEIIYSRYRHDYRESKDGGCFVDGGFDYFRWGGDDGKHILLKLDRDKLVEVSALQLLAESDD